MNEHDLERHLQQQPLAQPSRDLDQRMQVLFENAAPHPLKKPVPLWLAAAACLTCAAIGFALRTAPSRESSVPAVGITVPPNTAWTRAMLADPSRRDIINFSQARLSSSGSSRKTLNQSSKRKKR